MSSQQETTSTQEKTRFPEKGETVSNQKALAERAKKFSPKSANERKISPKAKSKA